MSFAQIIENTYLPLSPPLDPEKRFALMAQTQLQYQSASVLSAFADPPNLSITEAMGRPEVISKPGSARSVLDTLAKLKDIFEDENLSQALSKLVAPNGTNSNPAFHDDSFAMVDKPVFGATKLKHMLERTDELIVCPGVYDGLSARVAMEVGFDAMYMV